MRRKATIIGVMSLVAVITGPFSTFDTMSLGLRAFYWPLSLILISVIVVCFIRAVLALPGIASRHTLVGIALGAIIAGPFAGAALLTVDFVVLNKPYALDHLMRRWAPISTISFFVGATEYFILPALIARIKATGRNESPSPNATEQIALSTETAASGDTSPEPLFLRHLNQRPDARLVSISTNDHYLDVVTDTGRERLLKRMSDALAELNGYPGLQIHRSHWVALDAIEGIERNGRRHSVRLITGDLLPVSRPNVPQLLKALKEDA